jgi:hypothetical protein
MRQQADSMALSSLKVDCSRGRVPLGWKKLAFDEMCAILKRNAFFLMPLVLLFLERQYCLRGKYGV